MNESVARPAMRPALRWTLLACVLLSAWALWTRPAGTPVPVKLLGAPRETPAEPLLIATRPTLATLPPLPARLPRAELERAEQDPFQGLTALAPAAPPPLRAAVAPEAPRPSAPALEYRFLGQFLDPAGRRTVYLARPGKEIAVQQGAVLDEGYVVEAITDDAVRLHFEALQVRVSIPIQAAGR